MNKIKHKVVISCFSSSNRKMRLSTYLTFPSPSVAIREPYQGPSRSSRNRIPKITCQFYWCYSGLYKTKIPKNNKYGQIIIIIFFKVNESTRKWHKAHRTLMELVLQKMNLSGWDLCLHFFFSWALCNPACSGETLKIKQKTMV